jgi:dolichol kinase
MSQKELHDDIPYSAEVQRKALHLLALVVPFGMALLGRMLSIYILVPLALLALTADILRVRSRAFAQFIERYFGGMMRGDERPPVGGPVRVNGATWVLISAALLAVVFPLHIAVPAFVMFMIADAGAALVGRRFGRIRWGSGPRTVEGSLAFLLVGTAVMALFPAVPFWAGFAGVAAGAAAEIPPRPFNDNVRVPMVTAAVLFVLM